MKEIIAEFCLIVKQAKGLHDRLIREKITSKSTNLLYDKVVFFECFSWI